MGKNEKQKKQEKMKLKASYEGEECVICAEPIIFNTIGKCNHAVRHIKPKISNSLFHFPFFFTFTTIGCLLFVLSKEKAFVQKQ